MIIKTIRATEEGIVMNVETGSEVLPVFFSSVSNWEKIKANNNLSELPNGVIEGFKVKFDFDIVRKGEPYSNTHGTGEYKHDKINPTSSIKIEVDAKQIAQYHINGRTVDLIKKHVEEKLDAKILADLNLFLDI